MIQIACGGIIMSKELFIQAITKFALGVIVVGLLVFLPAGSILFKNGWLFIGTLFIPISLAGIVMMIKNPELLKKRLNAKEEQREQSLVVKLSGLMFIAGFIVAGLNFRFDWYMFPKGVSIGATVIYLVAYLLFAEALRENTYLSRTIEVQENQKVIDTGLYSIVRHPMYSVTLFLFLSMPLILGSVHSFLIFLVYPLLIAKGLKMKNYYLKRNWKVIVSINKK